MFTEAYWGHGISFFFNLLYQIINYLYQIINYKLNAGCYSSPFSGSPQPWVDAF